MSDKMYDKMYDKLKYDRLNPEALVDLYGCCLSAQGAYEALKLCGADKHLPGYEYCLTELKKAIEKAEKKI